jgi:hypothetical protein
LRAQALAFRQRLGKSARVVFVRSGLMLAGFINSAAAAAQRASLRLAAVQVLAQLGGKAFFARRGFDWLGHGTGMPRCPSNCKPRLTIQTHADKARLCPAAGWSAGCTLL